MKVGGPKFSPKHTSVYKESEYQFEVITGEEGRERRKRRHEAVERGGSTPLTLVLRKAFLPHGSQ